MRWKTTRRKRALAASDLLRAGHFDDAVVQRVRARLPHLSEVGVWTVLTAIKYSSKPAIAFFDVVAVIAAKRKASPEVRRIAASVVGRIGQGRVEAEQVLLNALKTSDWRIVEGVVEGFVAIGGFPRKAGERLVALLSSADDSMRIAAARAASHEGRCGVCRSLACEATEVGVEHRRLRVDGNGHRCDRSVGVTRASADH